MTILHIVSTHLTNQSLAKLAQRSHTDDAFVLMDDGVYTGLGLSVDPLGGRDVYLLHEHVLERGLGEANLLNAVHINMEQLVGLTVRYSSSMSW